MRPVSESSPPTPPAWSLLSAAAWIHILLAFAGLATTAGLWSQHHPDFVTVAAIAVPSALLTLWIAVRLLRHHVSAWIWMTLLSGNLALAFSIALVWRWSTVGIGPVELGITCATLLELATFCLMISPPIRYPFLAAQLKAEEKNQKLN
jgi:hypothetical protein